MSPLSAFAESTAAATPIQLVTEARWPDLAASLDPLARAFAASTGFEPKPGRHCLLPGPDGGLAAVLFGVDERGTAGADPLLCGKLPGLLPARDYRFANAPTDPALASLAWLLGAYRFSRYRRKTEPFPRLVAPDGIDAEEVGRIAAAIHMGRDLVNTPANDLAPDGIEAAARTLAERHGASFSAIVGDDLLAANFPLIHAVGRASATPPRLIDLRWGDESHPKITLVGKGVAFDTGGLDIKPSAGMLLMKKDMGGAAAALACADMIMGAGLPVRLRVLIPAVENAISALSFRPGDILPSRKGLTVEIGNTDAEGRLILADALALADEEQPELIADFATLTGAARVALGPDLPPFYTDDEDLAASLTRLGDKVADPVWRMPLWPPYARLVDGKIADLNNAPAGGFAGSITAALFLRRFVTLARTHLHFDIYGWNPSAKPGRPEGGEVQGARLLYAHLKSRYGNRDA
jgi:leucyl aminopeptidase